MQTGALAKRSRSVLKCAASPLGIPSYSKPVERLDHPDQLSAFYNKVRKKAELQRSETGKERPCVDLLVKYLFDLIDFLSCN